MFYLFNRRHYCYSLNRYYYSFRPLAIHFIFCLAVFLSIYSCWSVCQTKWKLHSINDPYTSKVWHGHDVAHVETLLIQVSDKAAAGSIGPQGWLARATHIRNEQKKDDGKVVFVKVPNSNTSVNNINQLLLQAVVSQHTLSTTLRIYTRGTKPKWVSGGWEGRGKIF